MADISVIIPVYNERGVIERCLESLARQTLKPKQVIVVDDGSKDKTWRILSQFSIRYSVFSIIKQDHKGAGAARNFGVSKAAGEILVFVDADMRFSRTFLADLTAPIREGKSKGTFSKSEFVGNWDNLWARFWNYQKGIYEPRAIPSDYPDKAPVFRAILKTEFDKAGGFDENRGYDDDWSLSDKLGYRAAATKARYYHDNPASLKEVFRQARWAGKRKYKLGLLGVLGNLARGLVRQCPANEVVFYPVFLAVYTTATLFGYIEFFFSKKVVK